MITNRRIKVRSLQFILLVAVGVSSALSQEVEPTGSSDTSDRQSTSEPAVTKPTVRKLTAEDRDRVLRNLETNLAERYFSADIGEKMAACLRDNAAHGKYDSISSADVFATTLTADLLRVARDRHLQVFCTDTKSSSFRSEVLSEVSKDKKNDRAHPDGASQNYGFEKLERLPGNIGYLDLRGFWSGEAATNTAIAAMGFLANADAVIIDLRENAGGRPSTLTFLASYLFPRGHRVHLYDIQTRGQEQPDQNWTLEFVPGPSLADKDVYLLTSHRTFSAGEGFAYFLQAQKRALIVGEVTGGGANPAGAPVTLDERLAVLIPNVQIISPVTKGNWERVGVKPDIEVSAELSLKTAHLKALKKLAENRELDAELKKLILALDQEIKNRAK